ncbi:hypothetical protein UCDDA912_g05126 [Diaporthe ampelina]|uniref:Uncharacterized protein n=1 Tax=Diaporthe ampelina TaxID=1214573 RepID=A0A0G2I4S0_9PEZI|nr:hypothetical protein UCDDA912_g05126 [Diaporthe ampelina]
MQLKTGFYFVSTIVTSPWGERWVQRNSVEDKVMTPKPVAVQVNETGAAQWYVEQIGDSKIFKLSAGSIYADPAPTIGKDGELCADISGGPATNWTLTGCETCGEGVFIITDGEGNAWRTPQSDDQNPQILLEYLIIPLIYPPKYPTSVQFKFASVDDVDH